MKCATSLIEVCAIELSSGSIASLALAPRGTERFTMRRHLPDWLRLGITPNELSCRLSREMAVSWGELGHAFEADFPL